MNKDINYIKSIKLLEFQCDKNIVFTNNDFNQKLEVFKEDNFELALKVARQIKFDLILIPSKNDLREILILDKFYTEDDFFIVTDDKDLNWKLEAKLENSLKELPPIISSLIEIGDHFQNCLTIVDMNFKQRPCIYVNDKFIESTGFDAQFTYGRNLKFLQGELTNSRTIDLMKDTLNNELACSHDLINYTKSGQVFFNRLVMLPYSVEEKLFYIGFQHNLTNFIDINLNKESILLNQDRFIRHILNNSLMKILGQFALKIDQKQNIDTIKSELSNTFELEYLKLKDFILNLDNLGFDA